MANGNAPYDPFTRRSPSHPACGRRQDMPKSPKSAAQQVLATRRARVPFAMSDMMLLNAVVEVVMLLILPSLVGELTCGSARLRDFGSGFRRLVAAGGRRSDGHTHRGTAGKCDSDTRDEDLDLPAASRPGNDVQGQFSVGSGGLSAVPDGRSSLAPMFEELLFRGLLQSWLATLFERRAIPCD